MVAAVVHIVAHLLRVQAHSAVPAAKRPRRWTRHSAWRRNKEETVTRGTRWTSCITFIFQSTKISIEGGDQVSKKKKSVSPTAHAGVFVGAISTVILPIAHPDVKLAKRVVADKLIGATVGGSCKQSDKTLVY